MKHASSTDAFTLAELLVVVAALTLLATIAVPAIHATARTGGDVACLANLHEISRASLFYATDDTRELIIPLHHLTVSTLHNEGFEGEEEWSWRTAEPCAFGGRTPVEPMLTESGPITVMIDESGPWGAPTRPLNYYVSGGLEGGLETFHCPADTGYPDADWLLDVPTESAGIPCWDFLGNSYREALVGLVWLSGSTRTGSFSAASRGHRASSLSGSLSNQVLYCEPLFHVWSRYYTGAPEEAPGWHGQILSDHVAYCDGSARMTEVGEIYQFTDDELEEMGYGFYYPQTFLRRGPTWQMDCYPTPGAFIRVFTPTGGSVSPPLSYGGWPFDDHQYNLDPE